MADSLDHLAGGRTQIEWLSNLNTEYQPKTNYRRTSIICTIGKLLLLQSIGPWWSVTCSRGSETVVNGAF